MGVDHPKSLTLFVPFSGIECQLRHSATASENHDGFEAGPAQGITGGYSVSHRSKLPAGFTKRRFPVKTNSFVCVLSHDEVTQYLAPGLGAAFGLNVLVRLLDEGLPDGDCRALVVDLDSVAPGRRALKQLVNELTARWHSCPVAAFGCSLEDDQIIDLRAAGVLVFQHCLGPAVFAAIAEQLSDAPSEALVC
jgi:hypothetical protein